MKSGRAVIPMLLVILDLALGGCSRTLWREDSPSVMRPNPDVHRPNQGQNSKSADEQIEILRQRIASHGGDPSERTTLSALDALNLELAGEPIADAAQSEGIRIVGVGLLKDPSEEVRFRAAELLGRTATEGEEPALLKVRETDPSPTVREMAMEAMEIRGLGEEVWKE